MKEYWFNDMVYTHYRLYKFLSWFTYSWRRYPIKTIKYWITIWRIKDLAVNSNMPIDDKLSMMELAPTLALFVYGK